MITNNEMERAAREILDRRLDVLTIENRLKLAQVVATDNVAQSISELDRSLDNLVKEIGAR